MNQTKFIYYPFSHLFFYVTKTGSFFLSHFESIILKTVFNYKMLYNVAETLETRGKMYSNPTITIFFVRGLLLSGLSYGKFYKAVCMTPTFLGFRAQTFCILN